MKYLLPLWILISSRVSQVLGILEWTVIGKVTDYGQNVTLFCHVPNCCPQDSGWDRYSTEQRTLFIDIKTGRPNKKYDGKVSRDGYTLIIQNLTKSDLNVSYSCVYGVTIGEPKFLLEEDVFKEKSSTQPDVVGSKIAAIIAGVLALVAVSIFIYVWTRRKKKKRKSRGENRVSKEELNPFIPKLSAPVGTMKIKNITESSVDIEWKEPEHHGGTPIKEYLIEYITADASIWTKAGNVDGTTHNFSVKDLKGGYQYYFKVTAFNSEGPGFALESAAMVELIAKLSAPVGPIEISNKTENSVDIEWKSPEHNGGASIKDYSIEYSTDDAATWTNAGHVDGTTHNFSLKGLQEGEYYFKVTATNSKGLTSELKSEDLVKLIVVSEAVKTLPEADRLRFLKIMQSEEKEKRYFVKIMIVGKESAGKTSLLRRLLKDEIKDVTSTDGINIVVRRCKMNIDNGKWTIEKDITDDLVDRIQNAIIQKQNKEEKKAENVNNEVTTQVMSEISETFKNSFEMEVESVNQDNVSNHSSGSSNTPGQLECGTQMVDVVDVETKYIENMNLDNVSSNTDIIRNIVETEEITENDNISESNKTDDVYVPQIDTMNTSDVNETHRNETSEHLVMLPDLLSGVLSMTCTPNSTSSNHTICGLWDFAGQKEFYCTHQAFLTSRAIYLIVADMNTNIWDKKTEKQKEEKMENPKVTEKAMQDNTPSIGDIPEAEYIDYWFDSIHCYRTIDRQEDDKPTEPPVIVVFTGTDKYNETDLRNSKKKLNDQLEQHVGKQNKYRHFQNVFFLSNVQDSDEKFEELRDEISYIAKGMQHWGEEVPLKWMLLERVIDTNKKRGKNFITFDDMINIAKHRDIGMADSMEVITFLHFQNEVGKIVFFDDIPDLIILEPQWLTNVFQCLVSDRLLEIKELKDVNKTQICSDLIDLKQKGEISDLLINTLFKIKGDSDFFTQRKQLLEIMKKFDILVEIEGKQAYIMPSRMPSTSYATVCKNLGFVKDNCKKTAWFCLKFGFLPPSFFNHLSVWLMSKYKPSKVGSTDVLALFKGFCVFDLNSSGCDKLLMTMSIDTIALQVVWFGEQTIVPGQYSSIRKDLRKKIIDIKKRYRIEVSYEQKFNCCDLPYNIDGLSFKNLKDNEQVYCYHHKMTHKSRTIYLPWTTERTKSLHRKEMAKEHEQILEYSLEYIVDNLHDVERICEYLEVDDILIEEDLYEIKQKSEKTRALLSILPYRGIKAYASFIDALKRTENIFVADYLGQEHWPDLNNRLKMVKRSDLPRCSEKLFTKICKSRQIYHMTGNKKGKCLIISNYSCDRQSYDDCSNKCRSNADFDKTSILQLFKHMQYESKGVDAVRNVTGDEMKIFLREHLSNKENSVFDSLVIVIFSGGKKYKPGKIYDNEGNEIDTTEICSIMSMIQDSTVFAGKPKIVILMTYNFEEETETYDVLDAAKQELHFYDTDNNKDLFVVSSQPRTKKGPWIIGEEMNGSYFIQAFIHVFKKMAYEKSFLEMMKEVNDCLLKAMVPVDKTSVVKEPVAEVMILKHCIKKELFFFPGLIDVPVYGWPDLATGRKTVRKKDVKMASFEFYGKILKDRKIYQMTNASNRGKFILISNAQCIQCAENAEDEEEKKRKYSACLANTDFDKSNMSQLLKSMGYESKGGDQVKNLKKEEIIEFLKKKVNEIDSDQSAKYDSLVILFLSGKYECDAGKIYDCDGKMVKRNEILEIIKGCQHFKGKPKVVFVQTYNFQDESHNYDTTDSANDLIKDCDPNKDDIFVVTNYPIIVQGPWILGEDMSGSYFIQALIHVFKQFACEKSFMELLNEANMCLAQAVVPKKTTDDGKSVIEEKKTVAQIAFLECCEGKDLYFFPGIDLVPIPKGFENKDFSESGRPVCAPSSENPN